MEIDDNGLEVLDEATCRRLLASAVVGRVGLCSSALPTVLPVSFVLTDDGIVFRTGRGAKLAAATHGAVVAFEVDEIDSFSHTGWSVVVTGVAREVTDPDDLARVRSLPIGHWGSPSADRHVRISTDIVTGRRIARAGAPARISGDGWPGPRTPR
jgi:nitroimidazol reductase NimA-like FMN-containing flavoprotein (pyridoxamine 5'-phosphate oxidase superfamily)